MYTQLRKRIQMHTNKHIDEDLYTTHLCIIVRVFMYSTSYVADKGASSSSIEVKMTDIRQTANWFVCFYKNTLSHRQCKVAISSDI